jgi:hypothetical protein
MTDTLSAGAPALPQVAITPHVFPRAGLSQVTAATVM